MKPPLEKRVLRQGRRGSDRPAATPVDEAVSAAVPGAVDARVPETSLADLVGEAVARGATDLLLRDGAVPTFRIEGRIEPTIGGGGPVPDIAALLGGPPASLVGRLDREGTAEWTLSTGAGRFRVSLYRSLGSLAATARRLAAAPPPLSELGLPEVVAEAVRLRSGLVLVGGSAGAGKTTTALALLRRILETRAVHVVTLEDPVEALLPAGVGVVSQREIGTDTPGFAAGVRAAVRQQADVLFVGEVRDEETAEAVIRAAEAGALVLATVQARSAPEALGRLAALASPSDPFLAAPILARLTEMAVVQKLVPTDAGPFAAAEILRRAPGTEQRLRELDLPGLAEEIAAGVAGFRMQSMNQSLAALVLSRAIDAASAAAHSPDPGDLDTILRSAVFPPFPPEDSMAKALSDWSKVHELRELRALHDEEVAARAAERSAAEARAADLKRVLDGRSRELIARTEALDAERRESEAARLRAETAERTLEEERRAHRHVVDRLMARLDATTEADRERLAG